MVSMLTSPHDNGTRLTNHVWHSWVGMDHMMAPRNLTDKVFLLGIGSGGLCSGLTVLVMMSAQSTSSAMRPYVSSNAMKEGKLISGMFDESDGLVEWHAQLSRTRHQSWATWKQCPFGAPPCWHTACSISLARLVREYRAWSNVGVARDFGLLAVAWSPE